MKKIPVQDISPEELSALNEWAAKLRAAQPQLARLGAEAKAVHRATVEAPRWAVAETERESPSDVPSQDLWSIGAPKVNYVNHIEGDPFESPGDGKEFDQ